MVQFVRVSELLEEPVTLRVCSSEARPIMCLRWQPYGTPSYLSEAGVIWDDSEFIKKASAVVELAIEGNYDLLLVPEYSFPHSALSEIVGDKSKWPKPGALWCLSAQGRERRAFLDELSDWKQSDVIVHEAKIGLEKNYVCPLVYLFVDATGERLNAIVQYKLHPSSDQWLLHEGAHLSTGSNVFLFDLSGPNTDCVNYFFSLICADILALEPVSTIRKIEELGANNRRYLIFHPQLNLCPKHSSFTKWRESVFTHFPENAQLLTLNWALCTELMNKPLTDAWSCVYRKKGYEFSDERLTKQIQQNHNVGLFFARNGHTDIWYGLDHEHVLAASIPRGHVAYDYHPVSRNCRVVANDLYYWRDSCWTRQTKNAVDEMIKRDLRQMLEQEDPVSRFPVDAAPITRDVLFGTCRGSTKQEFTADSSEQVVRTQWSVGIAAQGERQERLGDYNSLSKQVAEGNLPPTLRALEEGMKLFVTPNREPRLDQIYLNLYSRHCDGCLDDCARDRCIYRGVVAISDSSMERSLEQEVDQLQRQVDVIHRDKVVLYYRSDTGIKYFDKHLCTSIIKGDRTTNLTSIST